MRKRTWISVGLGTAIALTVALTSTELYVRSQLEARLGALETGLNTEGLSLSPGATPALLQAVTGQVDLTIAIEASAVAQIASCRLNTPVEARIAPDEVELTVDVPLRGTRVPATLAFHPVETESGWQFLPGAISVSGIEVPTALLNRAGAALPRAAIEGISLPHEPESLAVTGVSLADEEVTLSVSVQRTDSLMGREPGPLGGCLG